MRLKEFMITIIIFTIIYVLFFVILDLLESKKEKDRERKRMDSLFQEDPIAVFFQFYAVKNNGVTPSLLKTIYADMKRTTSLSLSIYEFVVAVLYLEYYQLTSRRNISIQEDLMKMIDFHDQELIMKYGSFFLEKCSYQEILERIGNSANQDLEFCNEHFLIPGVRMIDSTIYYVGEVYEKN